MGLRAKEAATIPVSAKEAATIPVSAKVFLAVALCAVAISPAIAAQGLLPASFGGWTAESSESATQSTLEKLAGANAAALREYGALSGERRAYRRGSDRLAATVYHLRDATGAYGAATFLRSHAMRPADLGEHSAISPERAVALIGNLILIVEQPGGNLLRETSDLKSLVSAVFPRAQQGLLPVLGDFLPAERQVPGSRRYALGPVALNALLPVASGDWIGFASGAEVEFARYRTGRGEATLLLAAYPTPQVAAKRFEEIGKQLGVNPATPTHGQNAVYGKRSASLVALVTGASSKAADVLLEPVRYDAEITWNEPGFSATEPPFGEMIIGIFYGTGALLVLALVVGIGFGGLRLLTKRMLPGRVFDRESAVEIIQLGITSKPIEAKDFYTRTR